VSGQKQIIDEIEAYICQGGGEYEDWFVGIANNPLKPIDEAMLFHKVQSHRFMYIETISPQVALAAVDYFINTLGTDGDAVGDEISGLCQAVYVYKKAVYLTGKQNRRLETVDLLRGAECRYGAAPPVLSKQDRSLYASRP
jgi:hypothetical protein